MQQHISLQKYFRMWIISVVMFTIPFFSTAPALASQWVSAYYAGWQQTRLTPEHIDFGAMTHIMHFAALPTANGGLNFTQHNISAQSSSAIITAAHSANPPVKVLLCVGGAFSGTEFRSAISANHRATFVSNLVNAVTARGYDGLDIDMEPIKSSDVADYSLFIQNLRTALNAADSTLLLTAAASQANMTVFEPLQNQFNQINVMAYDQSGAWESWETWYNAALYNNTVEFQHPWMRDHHGTLPSTQKIMQAWLSAGLAKSKLGVGIPFYGTKWNGVTGSNQSITDANGNVIVTTDVLDYYVIMAQYYTPDRVHWDNRVSVPYLSIDNPGNNNDAFISFENEESIRMKVQYTRNNNFGGLMIWELGSGYRADQSGVKDTLLQTVKTYMFN